MQKAKPRMKLCPRCGRKLWLREFYHMEGGRIASYCKKCSRERAKEAYERRRKNTSYVFKRPDGVLIQIEGKAHRIYWSGNMVSMLRRYFPITTNAEMVEMLGVSLTSIKRKVRELGLTKDEEFIRKIKTEASFSWRYKKKKQL